MHRVQRLFSSFPTGRTGIGLLLLRLAAGFFLVLHSRSAFEGTWTAIAIGSVAVSSAILLAAGFLTPIAGVLGVAAALLGGGPVCGDLAIAASLVLVGPGAYSVDARLFGRREIVIARQK
jgi:hypothetical protein